MVEKYPIVAQVNALAEKVANEQGVELVHVEILGAKRDSVVRIFIDKENGVSLDDCARFSGGLEERLDAEDLIPWAYVLEVSSPGIERGLYSLKDFVRFVGEAARIKTSVDHGGQRNFSGVIAAVEGDVIVFEDRASGSVMIPYSEVEKANLKMDFGKELKGSRK